MHYIVKLGKLNWSGQEFSNYPAKAYTTITYAAQAVEANQPQQSATIKIVPLTQNRFNKLLSAGMVRL